MWALWPHLVFVAASLAFCREALLPGHAFLPASLSSIEPWLGAGGEAGATRSNPLMMDALIFTLPGRMYNHDMLRAGEIPFWNPHIFCGYPHLALIQNNALYPLSAPLDVLDPIASLGLSILLHLALAGSLMFVFLRAAGVETRAAIVGGVAFELNGMFLVRASAPSYVFSGTWLPLLLLGALGLVRSGSLRRGWPVLLGTWLAVLGGHPQIAALALLLAAAYVVCLAAGGGTGGPVRMGWPRAGLAFGALAVLGVGLAGFQVVPFLELMRVSARTAVPLDAYRSSALPVVGLLQAIVPDVFGHPIDGGYWFGESAHLIDGIAADKRFWVLNYTGENLFTGVAPLVLAAVAVRRSTRRREVVFFAVVALASLAILLGTPLLGAAHALIPGFRHSRPDRIAFPYMASLAVLSAFGAEAVRRGGARSGGAPRGFASSRWIALLAIAIVGLAMAPRLLDAAGRAAWVEWFAQACRHWAAQAPVLVPEVAVTLVVLAVSLVLARPGLARRLPAGATLVLWLVLVAGPNLDFGWRFNPVQPRPVFGRTAAERLLMREPAPLRIARLLTPGSEKALPANLAQAIGVDDANGASAAGLEDYLRLVEAADPQAVVKSKYFRAFRDPAVARGRLLDLLGVRLVLADGDLPERYAPVPAEGDFRIFRNPGVLPRFFLVPEVEVYADADAARARLLAPDFDPARVALLERPPSQPGRQGERNPGGEAATVVVERFAAHEIALRVGSGAGGVLVSSEVFYPGWEARVDGAAADLLKVDTAFRGVAVPPGEHRVELIYVPRSFYLGLAVTVVCALVGGLLWRRPG